MGTEAKGYLETRGTGSAAAAPDVAVVSLGLSCPGPTVAVALTGLASSSDRLLQSLAEREVGASDVQSTRASLDQEWDHEGHRVTGFSASQTFAVRLHDVGSVGDLVGAAAGAAGDAFRLHGLSWQFADAEPLLALAREAAFRDAEAKARQYADLAGRGLGPVLRVRESGGAFAPRQLRSMVAGASVEMAPGESELTASVTVRWRLT
ncbi:MAG: SIMPL domain-containing protein [Nocardioidaceae bacterium]